MKTRSDFVSNSSSCSFIVALNQEYDTSDFAKDLAKACSNPSAEYHNKDRVKRNQRILDFCLDTYELAFLGTWKLRTDEHVRSKEDFMHMYGIDDIAEPERAQILEETEHEWNHVVESMGEHDGNCIDEDGKIHMFEDVYVSCCPIDADTMEYDLHRYGYDSDDAETNVKCRVEQLKKLAEEFAAYENGKLIARHNVGIYAITMNTIKNTRNLLDAGIKLIFDKHENLDSFQKRLETGQKLFVIDIGHDGEGYSSYQIYCEDGADGLDCLPVEIIQAEPQ